MKSLKLLFVASALIFVQAVYGEETTKVAIIGNSITEGTFLSNPAVNSYPGQLAKLLPLNWEVGNFGVSGRTMLKNGDFPIWNEQKFTDALNFDPDIVVIMLGTNDSKPYNWDDHMGEFYDDYISMIDTFEKLSSNPEIIVVYPPKAFSGAYDIVDSVIYNGVIPIVEQVSIDRNLKTIDCYTPTSDKPELFSDGIHPNLEGAHFLAEIFYTGLTGNTYQKIYDQNLVLGKSIISESKDDDSNIDQDATLVADGEMGSFWSFKGYPSSLTIDLVKLQTVDQFELFFRNHKSVGLQYKIETSNDSEIWSIAVDNTDRTDTTSTYSFDVIDPTDARFIKITFTGTSTSYDDIIEINEFKVLESHGFFHAPLLTAEIERIYYGTMFIVPTAESQSMSFYTFDRTTNTSKLYKTITDITEQQIYKYRAPSPDPVLFMTNAYKNGIEVYSDTTKVKHVRPVTSSVSIKKENLMFTAFPNPSSGEIQIKSNQNIDEQFTVKILDINGSVVKQINEIAQEKLNDKFIWNGDDSTGKKVAPGIYMLQITGNTIHENLKVVIE